MHGVKELVKVHKLFPKLGFGGCGNMVEAFLSGVMPLLDSTKFVVASPSLCSGKRSTRYPLAIDNRDAVRNAKLIFLGAKPKDIPGICEEIALVLDSDAVVVTMAAGIPLNTLQFYFGANQCLIRIMPNTPVKKKMGVIAMSHTTNMSTDIIHMVTSMLETVGHTVLLEREADMDSFTAVYGCGPAYFFLLLECLEAAADKHGFLVTDIALRRACLVQIMKSTAELLENSEVDFAEALRHITSPDSVARAALKIFKNHDLKTVIEKGIDAATARSKEMGQLNTNTATQVDVPNERPPSLSGDSVSPYSPNINSNLTHRVKQALDNAGYVASPEKAQENAFFYNLPVSCIVLLESLAASADNHGLMVADTRLRRKCLIQLMKGSAMLLENSALTFEAARLQVTSPKGATYAAMGTFEKADFKGLIIAGMDAVVKASSSVMKLAASKHIVFKPQECPNTEHVLSKVPDMRSTQKFTP